MPGIAGIIEKQPWITKPETLLLHVAQPQRFDPIQNVETRIEGRCAAAVVDYGEHLSFLKRPIARKDGVLLILAGEVYPEARDVPHELTKQASTIQRAEYCLHLYLRYGPHFVRHLNGSFAIAVHDSEDNKTHLFTDRFNSKLLCYWHRSGVAAFATSMRSLLNYRDDIGTRYDPQGLAELIVFERVFDERTLFPDIHRMPPAGHAVWDGRSWSVTRYLEITPRIDPKGMHSWEDAAHELNHLLQSAMDKRTIDDAQIGVLTSGGADSRLLLTKCPHSAIAMTFSNKDAPLSKETKLAVKVCDTLGIQLELLDRELDYYASIADDAANVTEALQTYIGCHSIGLHQRMKDLGVEVLVSGQWFDTLFKGYFGEQRLSRGIYEDGPLEVRARRAARIMADTAVIRRGDRQDLLNLALTPMMKECVALAKEQAIDQLSKWLSFEAPLTYLIDTNSFTNLQRAGASLGFNWGLQAGFLDRSPFMDNDLFEFGLTVPVEWKLRGRLVRRALHLASPPLGKIPDANTGLPVSLCPPWDKVLGTARQTFRNFAKTMISLTKQSSKFRQPPDGCRVFTTHNSWHDMNGALKLVPAYRQLVQESLERLDPEFFDVDRVRSLLKHDLDSSAPLFNSLFEIIITFSLFDQKWGPRSRTKTSLEPVAVS